MTQSPPQAQVDSGDQEPTFESLAAEVDRSLRDAEAVSEAAGDAGHQIRAAVEACHRPALVRIVRALRADPRGKELLFEVVDDPAVRAIFALHNIIKADPLTRGKQALDAVRPYLQSHGGDVELVRIEGGAAFVRLQGACSGCSMSAVTLKNGVEEALVSALEEVTRIEVLDDVQTESIIPLSAIDRGASPTEGWTRGPAVDDVLPASTCAFDRSDQYPDGRFLAVRFDNRISVFRNACAHQGLPLSESTIEGNALICPWHRFTFDASSGECTSAPGAQLERVPARVDDGFVWIRPDGS